MKKLFLLCFSILLLSCLSSGQKSPTNMNKNNEVIEKKELSFSSRCYSSNPIFHYSKAYEKPYHEPCLIGAEGWIYPSHLSVDCGSDTSSFKKIKIVSQGYLSHQGHGLYRGSLDFQYIDSIHGTHTGTIDYRCFSPDYRVGIWWNR